MKTRSMQKRLKTADCDKKWAKKENVSNECPESVMGRYTDSLRS
jgi:hypothetical protein